MGDGETDKGRGQKKAQEGKVRETNKGVDGEKNSFWGKQTETPPDTSTYCGGYKNT